MEELLRWSVVCDEEERIWLRIGNDQAGVGIWLDTTRPGVYASWSELTATAVLAEGRVHPRSLSKFTSKDGTD